MTHASVAGTDLEVPADLVRLSVGIETSEDQLADLDRALYHAPYDPDAQRLMGQIYARASRFLEAVSAYKLALWSAESADARTELAEVLLKTGDRDAAKAEVDRALVLVPGHPAALRLRQQLNSP